METKIVAGHRIKLLREERGMTLQEVCDAVNKMYGTTIHKGTLSKWENGVDSIGIEYVLTFSRFYDETTDFILGASNIRRHPELASKVV